MGPGCLNVCEPFRRHTAHKGEVSAYTWRLGKFALGEYLLQPPERESGILLPKPKVVTSVAVTCCGNTALVGSAGGRLDRYNLQSGIHGGGFYRSFPKSRKAAKSGAQCSMHTMGLLWVFPPTSPTRR